MKLAGAYSEQVKLPIATRIVIVNKQVTCADSRQGSSQQLIRSFAGQMRYSSLTRETNCYISQPETTGKMMPSS